MGDVLDAWLADGLATQHGNVVSFTEDQLRVGFRKHVLPSLSNAREDDARRLEELFVGALCTESEPTETPSGLGHDIPIGRYRINAMPLAIFLSVIAGVAPGMTPSGALLQASSLMLAFATGNVDEIKREIIRILADNRRPLNAEQITTELTKRGYVHVATGDIERKVGELRRDGLVKDGGGGNYVGASWWARTFGRRVDR